ncbi:MAG: hypothetical protein E6X23_10395 [Mixta calida]|uniref:hypothetical protein n=1 Tax=Mixta calida TaxID=665913 RepID=UPI0029085867|nr:hypothetical protein [Mixta calida]MDU4941938.1 hypothetical protein [Mixta calida]
MNTLSYPRLLLATTGGLGCIFAFFAWHNTINQSTFLARKTLHMLLVAGLILGLCLSFCIKKRDKDKRIHGIMSNIKLYAGSVLIVAIFSYILLSTVVWLLPGTTSTYTATSEYSARSRNDCSGAYVDDPDLKRRIKVCEPAGDYFDGSTLRVTKRSNALGMTVVHAVIKY